MTILAFIYVVASNEVFVGTEPEIKRITGKTTENLFHEVEELVQALQVYRSQEIIITFISYPSALQLEWEKDVRILEKTSIYLNNTNMNAKLK
ncbi:hypothetical protein ATL39_2976 [Sinobaca qinghaiensis]|uniref:Uncharacterized protein n=1 Tax=Sinobaca qinghaiensis TaxID=342944 RepID=A0A419UWQ4_9BACL|nr:hypothetical protein [Sinobaca qinghaiensis]RKD69556.1 hypothetical protein ATL39_2976 [Sinobaca qinghaiensis]